MDGLTSTLQSLGAAVGPYLPRLGGAVAILIGAWLAARLVRIGLQRAGEKAGLDERAHHPGLSALLGTVAGGLVWLFALPALLGTLELTALLEPVNAMMTRLLGFLPNVFGALVILGIGLLLANVVRQVVSGLLKAAGSERAAERMGLGAALGESSLADMVASVVFALILLPVLAASLDALGMDTVTRPVSQLLDAVVGLIPRLVSAALIMVVAAILGRVLAGLVGGLLAGLGINHLPRHLGLGDDFRAGGRDMSELGGMLVMGAILFVALAQASEVIGLSMLTQAVTALGSALAHIVVALAILLAGLWIAALAAQMIAARASPHAALLALIARIAIMFFAGALALRQAGLPADIVTLLFGSVVVGLALGVAIAVGVGGQRVAGRLLDAAADALSKKKSDAGSQGD
jgi:Conserved TM helix